MLLSRQEKDDSDKQHCTESFDEKALSDGHAISQECYRSQWTWKHNMNKCCGHNGPNQLCWKKDKPSYPWNILRDAKSKRNLKMVISIEHLVEVEMTTKSCNLQQD